jgi:hypothetical protein
MADGWSTLRAAAITLLIVIASQPGAARGEPPTPDVASAPQPSPDVANAPLPAAESGQTWNEESEPHPSGLRKVARAVLSVPKAVLWVLFLPARGLVWLYDRYDLEAHYYAIFFNTARTFGIHPYVEYATGTGLMFGAQLTSTDTFGEHERLTVTGTYGGTYQARADAWLNSGKRLDPLLLTVGGNFVRYAALPFYGVGNANLSPRPPFLIDPLIDDTAVQTYYRYQELRAALTADWRVFDHLHLIGHGAVTNLKTSPSTTSPSIQTVYNPATLVGFDSSFSHLYGQLELRWDRRGIAEPRWEMLHYTSGWLVSGFVGGVDGWDQAHNFGHYGVDLQAFIHLGLGPRVLWLRFLGEGVTDNLDEIPYFELPYLGGDFLRGYDFARFRDRVSGLGTAQYFWDMARGMDAFLFVDVGRVYGSIDQVTLHDLRAGFGGGIQMYTAGDFLFAASVASSIDGGLFFTVTLAPYWDRRPRWR